ncbi:MAG: hypothetical protein JWM43_1988 [Acidobacteriaceae bacterium]|nr:hypothetical protein [Acidobacteriaceae bacterium]
MTLFRTSPRLLGCALALGAVTLGALNSQALAQNSDLVERYMTSVQTELAGKIDTRNAAAGQAITLLTRKAATLADGTEIPKGSRMIGHIVEVHASSGERAGSTLTLLFDRMELAGGKSLPVRSMMRILTPTSAATGQNDGIRADQRGVTPGGTLDPMGVDTGGLDSRGGPGTGTGDPATGGMGGPRTSRRGPILGQGPTPAMIPDAVGPNQQQNTSTRKEGETIGAAPRPTGLEGVLLAKRVASPGAANADTSGTLIGVGRNIHLDGGTVMVLGVIGR